MYLLMDLVEFWKRLPNKFCYEKNRKQIRNLLFTIGEWEKETDRILSDEAIRVAVVLPVEQRSPQDGRTDYFVKEAPVISLVTTRSTTRFGVHWNVPMFPQQKNQRVSTQRWWKVSRLFNPGATVKWTQPYMERHSCGHHGQLLHANHINDTIHSARRTGTAETNQKYADIIQLHIETLWLIRMDGQCFLESLGESLSSVAAIQNKPAVPDNICAHPNFQFAFHCCFLADRSDRKITSEPAFNIALIPQDIYCLRYLKLKIIMWWVETILKFCVR